MADEFRVSLKAELNQASLDAAIRKAKSDQPLKISKFTINASDLAKQLQSELNKSKVKVKVDGDFSSIKNGSKEISKVNSLYQEMLNLTKKIGSTEVKIKGLDAQKDAKQIEELTAQLEKYQKKLGDLRKNNAESIAKFSSAQTSNLLKAEEAAQEKVAAAAAKAADKKIQAAERASKAQQRAAEQAQKAAERAAQQEQATQARAAKQTEKEWNQAYAGMKKDLEKVRKEALTLTKSETLSNNIQAWMSKNTQAADVFGAELRKIIAQLGDNRDPAVLTKANAEFAKIQAQAKSAGLVTSTFAKSIKDVGLQVLGLGSAYQVIMKLINTIKEGVNTIVELDTALVDLRKTTTMSSSELAAFYRDANEEAKMLGTTTQQIIQSAADWSRLGYSSKNDATMMARYAAQFAAISPGMNVDQATTGLVSVMKAYGIQTDEVLDGVMSKINRVGNTAATNNAEIIEGLQNSASALAAMNTDLDKSIALFTAGQEIAQQSSKVGNALRSISLRIRGYSEETEELSDDLVTLKGEVIDLTKVASNNYQGVSLFTDASQTEYKDVYDYLQDISKIWDELDAKTRQTLMEKLFGKNRANIGLAIIQNFEAAEKALREMGDSAGDADREMSIIMDSLEYKINALKETGVGIWQNLFPREDIGNAVELLTGLLEIIQKVTDVLGPAGTLATVAGAGALFKSFG